jgi:hypothetical protein
LDSGVNSTQRGPKNVENACIFASAASQWRRTAYRAETGDGDTSDELRPRIGAAAMSPDQGPAGRGRGGDGEMKRDDPPLT